MSSVRPQLVQVAFWSRPPLVPNLSSAFARRAPSWSSSLLFLFSSACPQPIITLSLPCASPALSLSSPCHACHRTGLAISPPCAQLVLSCLVLRRLSLPCHCLVRVSRLVACTQLVFTPCSQLVLTLSLRCHQPVLSLSSLCLVVSKSPSLPCPHRVLSLTSPCHCLVLALCSSLLSSACPHLRIALSLLPRSCLVLILFSPCPCLSSHCPRLALRLSSLPCPRQFVVVLSLLCRLVLSWSSVLPQLVLALSLPCS